jgi:Ca2+-binding RTX toxin-like protein
VFNTSLGYNMALGNGNVDRIQDFNPALDQFELSQAIFGRLPLGALPASQFRVGPAAADADDHIIFNNATGALFYDPDGYGPDAQVQFATIQNLAALSAADFLIVA